ncbi:hypothetical protein HMPREF0554_0058 [Pseudoleptotrichia goodfellowii F0264]|uniref:Uncharacterized protein n=1 Tax=Pseudoleptotrichia goodfellowii F0264 TaxID=596323 RepID=D0GPM4_9FUSO|nr:hypothetical protein HMPREF0554_0058 [Pseudoleptotrichia goodfellowii F0264]
MYVRKIFAELVLFRSYFKNENRNVEVKKILKLLKNNKVKEKRCF